MSRRQARPYGGASSLADHRRRIALSLLLACWCGEASAEDALDAESQPAPSAAASPSEGPASDFADDPAALAPLGVSDGSTLPRGRWSLSYRYSLIHLDDLRDGTSRQSTSRVLTRFDETPRKRDLHVHRIGLAYAPHRRVTLSAQLPILVIDTDARAKADGNFSTDVDGLGDLELRVLVPFMRKRDETLQVEMGLSAPTGSTGKRGRDATGVRGRLSFPQQLGSGTVDLLPGIVYRGHHESLSWGFVARGVFRVYDNSRDYRLGNEYEMSGWLARSWADWLSSSLRLSWQRTENIHPADRTFINADRSPEEDPKRQAGDVIELGPGLNFKLPFVEGPRFGVEMAWPVYQHLDGPQLERDWRLTAGWKWAF